MNLKNQAGFTLVEMAVVIAILGILMAVGLPNFSDVLESAEVTQIRMEIMQARVNVEAYLADRVHWGLDEDDFVTTIDNKLEDITFSWKDNDKKEYYILEHTEKVGDKMYKYDSEENEILLSE